MRLAPIVVCLVVAFFSSARADKAAKQDFDFFMRFETCKMVGAPRALVEDGTNPLTEMKTLGDMTACERTKKRSLTCLTTFDEKHSKPASYPATITHESMVGITIETANGGDLIDINPAKHAVVRITRLWGDGFLAVKICHGMFMTADELDMLEKSKSRRGN